MTTLRRKFEGDTEVRATAADVLHDIITNKPHHVSHAASHFIQSVDLHEGDHGQVGSKTLWKYKQGGKSLEVIAVIEEIDEEKKYVKHQILEGDLKKDYKSFTSVFQVIPKDSEACIARWTFEYEKMHPGIPEPTLLMDSWLDACNHLDDHHHGIKN